MTGDFVPIFGIPEVDQALLPALPVGWLGLLEGGVGAGAALVSKQAAHATSGLMPTFYYTTHESTDEVSRIFDEFGWDVSTLQVVDLDHELFAAQRARDIAIYRARAKGLTLAEATVGDSPTGAPVAPGITGRLLIDIAPLDTPFRFVLDSFDMVLELLNGPEATALARQIRHQAYVVGGGALLVMNPAVPEARTRALLEIIADFVVEMELVPEGNRFHPQMIIQKVRNHPELSRTLRGTVTSHGIEARP
jgi:KaiC/GvpD/RAD55 family RecA-like ATPase